jgi:hypothetical protein
VRLLGVRVAGLGLTAAPTHGGDARHGGGALQVRGGGEPADQLALPV